jgi:hypothetical protein
MTQTEYRRRLAGTVVALRSLMGSVVRLSGEIRECRDAKFGSAKYFSLVNRYGGFDSLYNRMEAVLKGAAEVRSYRAYLIRWFNGSRIGSIIPSRVR